MYDSGRGRRTENPSTDKAPFQDLTFTRLPQFLHQQQNMANARPCLAQLSRSCLTLRSRSALIYPGGILQPFFQARHASTPAKKTGSGGNKQMNKKKGEATKKKKKARSTYLQYDMKDADQFSLCDAMRYENLPLFFAGFKLIQTDIFELLKLGGHLRRPSTNLL